MSTDHHLIKDRTFYSRVKIILVETETPGNLGASARAMKSMGFTQLCLVNPQKKDSRDAIARAVNAEDILSEAKIYDHLHLALADCQLTFGTSGQIESLDQPRYSPRQLAQRLKQELLVPLHKSHQNPDYPVPMIGIVFGRESRGLNRQELSLCSAQIRIQSHSSCPSLNLASAVQVICYELSSTLCLEATERSYLVHRSQHIDQTIDLAKPLASHQQLEVLFAVLESLAIKAQALNPQQPRQMMRHLRALFLRASPRQNETSLMINLLKRAENRLSRIKQTSP